MATPGLISEFGFGDVDVYVEQTLGVGSYGKVCKAKCGQLPCAAKLLHDTMFGTNDPGICKFMEQFEQECRFLGMIKHPNIVQFLGTVKDPRSQKLALLMELMDESLSRYLERSTSPLPYHTQLNICHDVALALAYLHSNDIIHRDLSSNNVLLIGDGSRTKVTDFGMSKLIGMNPRMTPLTMCPGTAAYMPPEALVTPPRYSNKLDCFSHGVLTIQIVTRQFPNPTDPTTTVEDARFPTGIVHVPVPERERRKKDIDLVDPNHPLLPLALHCLKDRDTERPSADELSGRLATLKGEQMYTHSLEQSREQNVPIQRLQEQIREKDGELARARANYQQQVMEKEDEFEKARAYKQQQIREKECELERVQADCRQQVQEKDNELEKVRGDHEAELREYSRKLQEKSDELERARAELCECRQQIQENESTLEQIVADCQAALQAKTAECERKIGQLAKENRELLQKVQQQFQQHPRVHKVSSHTESSPVVNESSNPVKLMWQRKARAPVPMETFKGAAVVQGNIAYFSESHNVYSFTFDTDKWTTLRQCEYKRFGLAIVKHKLTTVGGVHDRDGKRSTLLCLSSELKWEQLLPPMPTARQRPATVTTPTHLIVAGGWSAYGTISTVEVLDINMLQWFSAISSPEKFGCPHMTLCGEYLYLSQHNSVYSCSVEELLHSCNPAPTESSHGSRSVWKRLPDVPIRYNTSLTTLKGHVLAIGGSYKSGGGERSGAIHSYSKVSNSWSKIEELPTPRFDSLVAVLPGNKLMVVGGYDGTLVSCRTNEIARTN